MTQDLPPVDDLTRRWWDATEQRRLLVQHCPQCDHYQHYPRAVCTACGSTDLEFLDAAGTGTVYSFTEVQRAVPPMTEAPYTVALVRLDEGPLLLTNIEGDTIACDGPVQVAWRPLADGRHLPVFRSA